MVTRIGPRQALPRRDRAYYLTGGLLLLLALNGCRPTLEDEALSLLETDKSFSAHSVDHGMADAFFRFMAPDGFQLRPGEDPVVGPEAVKSRLSKSTDVVLSWIPQAAEVSASRDFGYTWGIYAVDRKTPQGMIRLGTGKYLNVWKKQPDGAWRVLVDIGNEDPPPGTD